jgi:hypothetical protein
MALSPPWSKLSKRILKHRSHTSTDELGADSPHLIAHQTEAEKPQEWKLQSKGSRAQGNGGIRSGNCCM